ncbi:alpha/beta hydrolase [Mesorhizobium sp. B2-4-14]|uniref:alpha/beta fold hydrolase n=1 Tax=Mesorhizobium sp. B2-4-14 TaxID=2589935 RepID=UPI00112A170A|nr:alpha/beta hydrolase [Mesorhizobium sp. B2-4-14]TPL11483.1 alpha/beta hydrolase [Mesorhizobium sp. B2-4-14]
MQASHLSIQPLFHSIDGLSIRIAESSKERGKVQALLLSPWPESIYAFGATWSRLAEHAHLIAVDLPGFGQSERRDSLMSPSAMGEFIIRLADELGLEQPHVVGPDVGTPAVLFAAARTPERFRSIIVGTGGTAVPLQLGGVLKDWVEAPSLDPYRRIDGRDIVRAATSTLERYTLSQAAFEDYLASYAGTRFAESMQYVRAYPRDLPILRDLLRQIPTPVRVIAGRHDQVVPLANAEFLVERLPNSDLAIIEAGHFIWEDAADAYAGFVTSWWDGGYIADRRRPRGPAAEPQSTS